MWVKGEFHERGEAGSAGVEQQSVEGGAGGDQGQRQDVARLFLELPGPEGPLVGPGQVADHALLAGTEVLPVSQRQPAQPLELLGRLALALLAQRVPFRPADLVVVGPHHERERSTVMIASGAWATTTARIHSAPSQETNRSRAARSGPSAAKEAATVSLLRPLAG
jgi:hypothetical protein